MNWHVLVLCSLMGVMGLVLLALAIAAIWYGTGRVAALSVVLASPVLILLAGTIIEGRSLGQLVTLDASWALMFGDLVLALGVWHTVNGLTHMTLPSYRFMSSAASVSIVVGIAAGIAFHEWDGNAYRADGFGDLVGTATKLAHDYVTLPFIVAMLCNLVALLVGSKSYSSPPRHVTRVAPRSTMGLSTAKAAVSVRFGLFLAGWLAFYVRDALVGLDPRVLHGGAAEPNFVAIGVFGVTVFGLVFGYAWLAICDTRSAK